VYDRPGKPYGGGYEIFANMQKAEADLMLWLGDNIYLREADWYSRTGIYERYAHYRSLPELQEFFASQANIAIWDDHDYGPNDSDRSYSMKETTLDAFKDFWANPAYGLGDCGGITGHYQFNDVEFFLLDNRWNRSPQGLGEDEEQVLGECQIDWLIEAMRFSRATYKIVCIGGQVLNTAKVYENMSNYEKERQYLLDQIAKYNIRNVVFLTGDRHHSELSEIRIGDLMIYDLTVSPLTSSAGRNSQNEGNKLRVEGTYFGERNYASLDFSGSLSERKLLITLYDTSGKRIWRREI
jgi:alkaline phosphatase D